VKSLLGALPGVVQEEREGTLKVTRSGRTLMLHPPARKNIADVQELMDLRRFLEHSDAPSPQQIAQGMHLLVVIDHREARIYKTELHGSVPQRIVPYDPQGTGRYLHYVGDDSNGQRKPEQKSFYEAIAKAMQDAEQVLLFGSGTGSSSAMEQLQAELKQRHPDLAERIVGTIKVDEQHLTENQILAKARESYANIEEKRRIS